MPSRTHSAGCRRSERKSVRPDEELQLLGVFGDERIGSAGEVLEERSFPPVLAVLADPVEPAVLIEAPLILVRPCSRKRVRDG